MKTCVGVEGGGSHVFFSRMIKDENNLRSISQWAFFEPYSYNCIENVEKNQLVVFFLSYSFFIVVIRNQVRLFVMIHSFD